MSAIRVLAANYQPITLAGLRLVLRDAVGMEMVAQASSGEETLRLVQALEPDVLLLGIRLQDMTGGDVLARLRKMNHNVKTLVLSSASDRKSMRELFLLGAAGFLVKDEPVGEIVEGVRAVARGDRGWLSRKAARVMKAGISADWLEGRKLSPRELDVLSFVVAGKSNSEIATILGIKVKTVENYMASVCEKLQASSRVEAAVMAVSKGLV